MLRVNYKKADFSRADDVLETGVCLARLLELVLEAMVEAGLALTAPFLQANTTPYNTY